jgi:small subunit ribosomal protein S3
VSSLKRGYKGRTKQSERPGGREKSRVDRPGEAKRNQDLAEKMQHYGYHDRSPSRKKNFYKSLWVSGAFKHPEYARDVNDIAFLIENDDSFIKTKLFKFFFFTKEVPL